MLSAMDMIKCIVIADGKPSRHGFAAVPRVGEQVILPTNALRIYKVAEVRHQAFFENGLEPGPSISIKLEHFQDIEIPNAKRP